MFSVNSVGNTLCSSPEQETERELKTSAYICREFVCVDFNCRQFAVLRYLQQSEHSVCLCVRILLPTYPYVSYDAVVYPSPKRLFVYICAYIIILQTYVSYEAVVCPSYLCLCCLPCIMYAVFLYCQTTKVCESKVCCVHNILPVL